MVSICLGTVFKVEGEILRKDVILDIGSGGHFVSARLFGGNKWSTTGVGTSCPENIASIVGKMTLSEVIEAGIQGSRKKGTRLNDQILGLLNESAKKGSRIIKIR